VHINAGFSNETELRKLTDLLYGKSKKGIAFTGLMEAISNEVTIITAIHNIKANAGSKTAGVDRNKMDKYLQMPKETVIELIRNTVSDYKPKPAKRIYIEKANGKQRPLGIPTVLDRIIQECIRIIIEPICEARFYPHSYGFRPYRAQKHAVRDIVNIINGSNKSDNMPIYALEGDIKGCFDNINHRILLGKLWKIGIHDKRLLKIISQMLKAGYMEKDLFFDTTVGTGQGSVISPLLANVYLNDFDWYVGRKYYHPFPKLKLKSSDMRKLRQQGIFPKYNIRFADDWVILTTAEKEAHRLKKELSKYFKYRLKLEISEEKTVVTSMLVNAVKFLGFNIRADKSKKNKGKSTVRYVAKPYPDYIKLGKKIKNLRPAIREIKEQRALNCRVAQIEYVNSIIIGIAEYIKSSISSHAFNMIDYRVNNMVFAVWKRMYPKSYLQMKIQLQQLGNLPARHEGHETKTFAVKYQGKWVGITYAFLTHVQYEKKPFNQNMTPYTAEGRMLYQKYRSSQKSSPRDRPALYSPTVLKMSAYKTKYNFEYYMNREYAFNRDKMVCRCCQRPLLHTEQRECHHVYPNLPLNQLNKVPNLAWVCTECHKQIHGKEIPQSTEVKFKRKIISLRDKLSK
jgi:RNA-directed DNA polymerase